MAEYVARGGETLCFLAVARGFRDCRRLRDANPSLANVEALEPGTRVTIPDITERTETGQTEMLHRFRRVLQNQPQIHFIFEEGKGYGQNLPAPPPPPTPPPPANRPELDRKLSVLAISNYVSDRAGDGLVVNDFPTDSAADYRFDARASQDPDHFKIQVHAPNIGDGQQTINLQLFAMRPAYHRGVVGGQEVVVQHPTKFRRPAAATRRLDPVVCRRIGTTKFFRSPYMRLVTTATSQARRPRQFLLMEDYFAEGPATYQRHYTEILDQRVEARCGLNMCPLNRCAVLKSLPLSNTVSLHMAFHIVTGSPCTPDQVRQNVYTWTRRVLASAGVRPVLERVETVPVPDNMLIIAGDNAATRGRHSSGRNSSNNQSVMGFRVDGHNVRYRPGNRHAPERTADGIMAAIAAVPALAGYTTQKFRNFNRNLVAAANSVSDAFDVIVKKPDGTPAVVSNVFSTDARRNGVGGQTLSRCTTFTLNNFPCNRVATGGANSAQRILRWNFSRDNCINFYVVGNPIMLQANGAGAPAMALDGFSPYGTSLGWITDVGPSVYITANGVNPRMFVVAHEMFHPLMHNVHAQQPANDANVPGPLANQSCECMNSGLVEVEAHDATKHIADAPITARYELLESFAAGVQLVDGGVGPPQRTTPVQRLLTIAGGYNIVRNSQPRPHDPAVVNDLPADANSA